MCLQVPGAMDTNPARDGQALGNFQVGCQNLTRVICFFQFFTKNLFCPTSFNDPKSSFLQKIALQKKCPLALFLLKKNLPKVFLGLNYFNQKHLNKTNC